MKEIANKILDEFSHDKSAMLCIITATSGATPRKAGSKMLVYENGKTFGSVGGGEVEYMAVQMALQCLKNSKSATESFSLNTREDAMEHNKNQTGMICGGEITILFAFMDNRDAILAKTLKDFAKDDENFLTGQAPKKSNMICAVNGDVLDVFAFADPSDYMFDNEEQTVYIEKIEQAPRAILFGAGHISASLAPVMKFLGFDVVVYDFREDLLKNPAFDKADKKVFANFDNINKQITIHPSDNVVVATPSHANDFDVLCQVLKSGAKYIGCLGSTKKTAKLNKKLENEGFTKEEIAKIDAPIGLNIGAQTPNEIAISIAAKIISCNNVKKNW